MRNICILICLFLLRSNCNSQEWITYSSPDNTFEIKFPGQPQTMTLKAGYGIDSTQIFQYSQNDSSNSYTYMLSIRDFSKEILNPEFNEEKRFEVLKRYATIEIALIGKVLNTTAIKKFGISGIYVEGEITQAVKEKPYPPIFVKSYLVEDRIYNLSVSCSYENKGSQLIDFYFDSFELNSN